MDDQNQAKVVADLVKQHVRGEVFNITSPDGIIAPVALVASGLALGPVDMLFEPYRTHPKRREGVATMRDLESFIAHANRFKDAASALFALPDKQTPSLEAVLDYSPGGKDEPRFGTHRTRYEFPLSDEWRAWQGGNNKPMTQGDFAEFLENRIVDVLDPTKAGEAAQVVAQLLGCAIASPSRLLELSRGLTVRVASKMQNAVNLASGEVAMQFVTTHDDGDGAPIKVPGAFLVGIPVFEGGASYQVVARLRYRAREGQVHWYYQLHRTEVVFKHAFDEACSMAQAATELPLFTGSPEE